MVLVRSAISFMEETGDADGRLRSCEIRSNWPLRDGESNGSATPIDAVRAFCLFFSGSVKLLFINSTPANMAGPPLVKFLYYNYRAKGKNGLQHTGVERVRRKPN